MRYEHCIYNKTNDWGKQCLPGRRERYVAPSVHVLVLRAASIGNSRCAEVRVAGWCV
jgi:hypothetical protein